MVASVTLLALLPLSRTPVAWVCCGGRGVSRAVEGPECATDHGERGHEADDGERGAGRHVVGGGCDPGVAGWLVAGEERREGEPDAGEAGDGRQDDGGADAGRHGGSSRSGVPVLGGREGGR